MQLGDGLEVLLLHDEGLLAGEALLGEGVEHLAALVAWVQWVLVRLHVLVELLQLSYLAKGDAGIS